MIAAVYRESDGFILRTVSAPPSLIAAQCGPGEATFLDCPQWATHIVDGEPAIIMPPVEGPTIEELVHQIVNAVQKFMDATARQRNYDSILSLCSYATSTDPVFSAEAAAGIAWRDACWRYCYEQLAAVEAGLRPMPTPEQAVAELPGIVWP